MSFFPVPEEFSHIFETDPQNGDFIGDVQKSKFFQGQNENFSMFFLERELSYLETQICCLDGTFTIVKNLPFSQLFMITAQFRHQENVISVPFVFILMRERKTVNYEEALSFLKMKFETFFERELVPRKLLLDCEMATIKALKKFFPYTKITLCRVHIVRNLRKKAIECFGRPFFEGNKNMADFWTIIKGLFYVPPTVFPILKAFFISHFRPKFQNQKNNFDTYLTYLCKNYLNTDSKFRPSLWSNYTSLADFEDFTNNTNPIESLNRVLKSMCPNGKINFYTAVNIIHKFKVDSLRKFHTAMWLEDMNPRKQSTVDREKKVLEIMRIFSEEADLEDPISLCNFCARFSLYDETVSLFETPRHITIL